MLEQFTDGLHFYSALFFSLIIWIAAVVAAVLYYTHNDRTHFNDRSLSEILQIIPESWMMPIIVAWLYVGSLPIFNYLADKVQKGGVVGRAAELGMYGDRPWYGMGGYQLLCVLLILIVGYLINRIRNS